MGRNAGSRRVNDTGSTTGVATTILALLSAGTVATITLVGVNQLAPAVSHFASAHEPSSLPSPRGVDVTPHSSASPSSVGESPGPASKPRASSPQVLTVVQMPTPPRGVTRVITGVSRIRPPEETPPSVAPAGPSPTPTMNPSETPTMRSPTGHAHPSRGHRVRHEHARRSAESTHGDRSPRSRRGSSGCRQHDGGGHRANRHGGQGDHSEHRPHGHGENGGDGAQRGPDGNRGHGHGGNGGSPPDRHGH
jgi:hypothetical protein